MPPRKLTDDEVTEVRHWLFDQNINPNTIHREFSDCVAVAHLLKTFNPVMIDLRNYPPRRNTQLKLHNWQTLNNMVLNRLGIHVTKSMMDKMSKGVPGAIEALLYDIMLIERSGREKEENQEKNQGRIWTDDDEILTVSVKKKIGDDIIQVPQRMILFSIYKQKVRESNAKDTLLESAQENIVYIENELRLMTDRIKDLSGQLAQLSPENTAGSSKM